LRPQDRVDFETWNHPNAFPTYRCAAAEAQAVGRLLTEPTILIGTISFSYGQSMIRYVRRGCLLLLITAAVLGTGSLIYGLTRPSALGQLARLAHIERTTDLVRVQAALLQQIPVGSSTHTIERFLHESDVEVDVDLMLHSRDPVSAPHFENKYIYCHPTDFAYGITCRVFDDADRLTFPCRDAFDIAFEFDGNDRLRMISVTDESRCL
jgi:hypothetical protein